ncbi:MAG: glycosyltransferase family 39 protein [Saprospiraceae bacterium]|nr:glycosyltransferase family 39 protein [Saprospiraceae bacterium]MBP6567017.1 glycosyltransferase family 39 protein [Saprospiraceae bacterium]
MIIDAIERNLDILAVIGLFVFISIFYNISVPSIYMWDEAVYANNALEMSQNNKLFPLYTDGKISEYNVKPPLVIWMQYIAIKLHGINELSIRLPSVLAGIMTCFIIGFFGTRNFNFQIGAISILILLTIQGYVNTHVIRSGDLDATLVFFTTAYLLLFLQDLIRPFNNRIKYFSILGILIFLAFLSKSIAGLMPLLGMVLAVLLVPENRKILREKYLYFSVIGVLVAIVSYYLIAELSNPGYFSKVWTSEFLRLTENVMPWHAQPFWFYVTNMVKYNFTPHIFILPLIYFAFKSTNIPISIFTKNALIIVFVFLMLISYPIVKLEWYDAPVYPILALVMSAGIYESFSALKLPALFDNKRIIFYIAALFLLFPLYKLYTLNGRSLPNDPLQYDGYAIRYLNTNSPDIKNYKVLLYSKHYQHYDQANFYIKASNVEKMTNIKLEHQISAINIGDTVLCSQSLMMDSLRSKFDLQEINKIHESFLFRIENILGN